MDSYEEKLRVKRHTIAATTAEEEPDLSNGKLREPDRPPVPTGMPLAVTWTSS